MPTEDQIRIDHDRAHPRLTEIWWALRPLTSVIRFMQTGAHPDDEISGMLAALAFRDGLNISYACSTRGEGGQNDIGTEAGPDLGALRTREMERACDILGMRLYWHGTHPAESITDFGFSKSGQETLARWGYDRTLKRFVEIVRTEKPDILCPTFLDVPGQHGHHRAMTQAALDVIAAAADPTYSCGLPPWQVQKLYLPAWSGAGQAYDDDLPPPEATLRVTGTDREPMTGWTWSRIGQQSRAFHRTQGMGRWVPAGPGQDWPLHLAVTQIDGPDTAVTDGLPRTLADLAALPEAAPISAHLTAAQQAIDAAIAAFPTFGTLADQAVCAVTHLRAAIDAAPDPVRRAHGHRLQAKLHQLGKVLTLALGVEARVRPAEVFVAAGSRLALTSEIDPGAASATRGRLDLPTGWTETPEGVTLSKDAAETDPYRAAYDPIAPARPRLVLTVTHGNVDVEVPVAFETEPVVFAPNRATLTPSSAVVNLRTPQRSLALTLSDLSPSGGEVTLDVPADWDAQRTETGFDVTLPQDVVPGLYQITAQINAALARSVRLIHPDHCGPTACARPASVTVRVLDVAVPPGKVGYIGAGNDRVGAWLTAMGATVTELSPETLQNDAEMQTYDALVIGIFAMRFRPGLADAMPAVHRWVAQGGTLVTLYHRPWDNWDPHRIPPRRLDIGMPSLRWRVTNEAAPVTLLGDHPILRAPNSIGPQDWDGWHKERGLYFAKSWDDTYTPLLSMSDPDESPLTGALLVADIGAGRHIHTSLILHHQMEHLVPGAFRLMANFIASRR